MYNYAELTFSNWYVASAQVEADPDVDEIILKDTGWYTNSDKLYCIVWSSHNYYSILSLDDCACLWS